MKPWNKFCGITRSKPPWLVYLVAFLEARIVAVDIRRSMYLSALNEAIQVSESCRFLGRMFQELLAVLIAARLCWDKGARPGWRRSTVGANA
jgi:hypothetical protein